MGQKTIVRNSKEISLAWGRLRHFIERRPERTADIMDARRLINNELPRDAVHDETSVKISDLSTVFTLDTIKFTWPGCKIVLTLEMHPDGVRKIHDVAITGGRRKHTYRPGEHDLPWQV
jgi:hypothetical protein